jgi:hypothetical protein
MLFAVLSWGVLVGEIEIAVVVQRCCSGQVVFSVRSFTTPSCTGGREVVRWGRSNAALSYYVLVDLLSLFSYAMIGWLVTNYYCIPSHTHTLKKGAGRPGACGGACCSALVGRAGPSGWESPRPPPSSPSSRVFDDPSSYPTPTALGAGVLLRSPYPRLPPIFSAHTSHSGSGHRQPGDHRPSAASFGPWCICM